MTDTSPQFRPATRWCMAAPSARHFGETAEALFLTSGFVYDSAEQAEATFAGTDRALPVFPLRQPDRRACWRSAWRCSKAPRPAAPPPPAWPRCMPRCCRHLKTGDRVVASRALFGSCHWIVSTLLPRYGIETEFVDGADLDAVARGAGAARRSWCCWRPRPTRCWRSSTCAAVAELAHAAGAIVVVDNVFATPLLQKPLELGADVVVYSCTKHIDGQGRVLGGAVLGRREMDRGDAAAVHPQHRPGDVAVQRLAAAEGAGDAGAAGRGRDAAAPRRSPTSSPRGPRSAGSGIRPAPTTRSTRWRWRR